LFVIITLMASNSGLLYQIYGVQKTLLFNSQGEQYDVLYVHEQDSSAAKYYSKFVQLGVQIYSDKYGSSILVSQGLLLLPSNPARLMYADQIIDFYKPLNGAFLFRYIVLSESKILDWNDNWHDLREYDPIFNETNVIYDSGSRIVIK